MISLSKLVTLIDRKEPLPSTFMRAQKAVFDLAFNRGIYSVSLDNLIESLDIELATDDINPQQYSVKPEALSKLVMVLGRFDGQMIPPGVPNNLSLTNTIYLTRRPHIELDGDISLVQSMIGVKVDHYTREQVEAIQKAKEKIRNYNVLVRVFEYLGALQMPPLDSNQRSVLRDILNEYILPHDGSRYVRSLFSYACDYGSYQYDYNEQSALSQPLTGENLTMVLKIMAKTIAASSVTVNVPDSFPWKAELIHLYNQYCPKPIDEGVTQKALIKRIPLAKRQLTSLNSVKRRRRAELDLEIFLKFLKNPNAFPDYDPLQQLALPSPSVTNAPRLVYTGPKVSDADKDKAVKEAMEAYEAAKAAKEDKAAQKAKTEGGKASAKNLPQVRKSGTSVATTGGKAPSVRVDPLQEALKLRPGFNPHFVKRMKDIVEQCDPNLAAFINMLQQKLTHDIDVRLSLPTMESAEYITIIPNFAHTEYLKGNRVIKEQDLHLAESIFPVNSTLCYNTINCLPANYPGFKYTVNESYSVSDLCALSYNYTPGDTDFALRLTLDYMQVPQIQIEEDIAACNTLVSPFNFNHTSHYLNDFEDQSISTSDSLRQAVADSKYGHSVVELFGQRSYHAYTSTTNRLTHLQHTYLIFDNNDHKSHLPDREVDYGDNLEEYINVPVLHAHRVNSNNCYNFVLSMLFSEENPNLKALFELQYLNGQLNISCSPLPYLFYHSMVYFDLHLEHPQTHFNNELFYCNALGQEPYAINIYLTRLISKYGTNLKLWPYEFYTLVALYIVIFPSRKNKALATELASFLFARTNTQFNIRKLVVIRTLANQLYNMVREHKHDILLVWTNHLELRTINSRRDIRSRHTKAAHSKMVLAAMYKGKDELRASMDFEKMQQELLLKVTLGQLPHDYSEDGPARDVVEILVNEFCTNFNEFIEKQAQKNAEQANPKAADNANDAATTSSSSASCAYNTANYTNAPDAASADDANTAAAANEAKEAWQEEERISEAYNLINALCERAESAANDAKENAKKQNSEYDSRFSRPDSLRYVPGTPLKAHALKASQGGELAIPEKKAENAIPASYYLTQATLDDMMERKGQVTNARRNPFASNLGTGGAKAKVSLGHSSYDVDQLGNKKFSNANSKVATLLSANNLTADQKLHLSSLSMSDSLMSNISHVAENIVARAQTQPDQSEINTLPKVMEMLPELFAQGELYLNVKAITAAIREAARLMLGIDFEHEREKREELKKTRMQIGLSGIVEDADQQDLSPFYINDIDMLYDKMYTSYGIYNNLTPLYSNYVIPVLKRAMANDHRFVYMLNYPLDVNALLKEQVAVINSSFTPHQSNLELLYNRVFLDLLTIDVMPKERAQAIKDHFKRDLSSSDLGFSTGISYSNVSRISDLMPKHLVLPCLYKGVPDFLSYSLEGMRLRFRDCKLLYSNITFNEVERLELQNNLYCLYLALEIDRAVNSSLAGDSIYPHQLDQDHNALINALLPQLSQKHKVGCLAFLQHYYECMLDWLSSSEPLPFEALLEHLDLLNDRQGYETNCHNKLMEVLSIVFAESIAPELFAIDQGFKDSEDVDRALDYVQYKTVAYNRLLRAFEFDWKDYFTHAQEYKLISSHYRDSSNTLGLFGAAGFLMVKAYVNSDQNMASDLYWLLIEQVNKYRPQPIKAFANATLFEQANKGVIEATAPAPKLELDMEKIRSKQNETLLVQEAITQLREEMEAAQEPQIIAPTKKTKESKDAPSHPLFKLDAKLRSVLQSLGLQQLDAIDEREFNGMCISQGLLSGGYCIEALNEYCYEHYDEPLLELVSEEGVIYISTDILEQLLEIIHQHANAQ